MRYETMSKTRYLFYIPFHPVTGFEEMKFNHKGSLKLANLLCVLTCVAVVVQQVLAAFLFRRDRVEDINVLWLVAGAVGLMFLFALGNWLFCTLLDGKGRFSEIWVVTCYSMLPFVAGSIPLTLLGHLFTAEQAFFYHAMMTALYAWSGLLLFIGTMCVHQFTISKTVMTLFFTLVGIVIMLFLLLLMFTLLQNVYSFFVTLYNEISFRIS